jgi:hypothetical protein
LLIFSSWITGLSYHPAYPAEGHTPLASQTCE